jgi:hypothetical protein
MSMESIENYLRQSQLPGDADLAGTIAKLIAKRGSDIPLGVLSAALQSGLSDISPVSAPTLFLYNTDIEGLGQTASQLDAAAQNSYNLHTAIEQIVTPYVGLCNGLLPEPEGVPKKRFSWLTGNRDVTGSVEECVDKVVGGYALQHTVTVDYSSTSDVVTANRVHVRAERAGNDFRTDFNLGHVEFSARIKDAVITQCVVTDTALNDPTNYAIHDPNSFATGSHELKVDLAVDEPTVYLKRRSRSGVPLLDSEYRFDPHTNEFMQLAHTPDHFPEETVSVDEFTGFLSRVMGIIPTISVE